MRPRESGCVLARPAPGLSDNAANVPIACIIRIKHLRTCRRGLCIIMDRMAKIMRSYMVQSAISRRLSRAICRRSRARMSQLGARATLRTALTVSVAILADFASLASIHAYAPSAPAHLSGSDFCAAEILVRAGLHRLAALRHGDGRGHLPPGHFSARRRSGALERRLCAAFAPAHRRTLRQQSVPPAALLSVSGLHQTLAGRFPGAVLGLAAHAGLRSADARHPLRRGQLGIADLGRLGPGLGSVAQRHGGLAVHLLPAGRRTGLPAR